MNYDESLDVLETHFGFQVPRGTSELFSRYVSLIREWNRFAGLVSPADEAKLDEHVADSLSLVPYLGSPSTAGIKCLDIGSGAGFPAIPIAAVRRDATFELWESSGKKAAFLRKATALLGLTQCTVKHGRFESESSSVRPDFVLSRAAARPDKLIPLTEPFLAQGASLLYQGNRNLDNPALTQYQILDEFDRRGLRRSRLSVVSAKKPYTNSST